MNRGRVFVVQGDLKKLACDHVVVPCDSELRVNDCWWTEENAETLKAAGATRFSHDSAATGARWSRPIPLGPIWANVGPCAWLVDTNLQGELGQHLRALMQTIRSCGSAYLGRKTPLIGIPTLGAGAADNADEAFSTWRELQEVLRTLAADYRIDVAVVAFDTPSYAALQSLRLSAPVPSWLCPHRDALAELGRRAATDKLVLFLGAGVGAGANLPMWQGLLRELCDAVGVDGNDQDFKRLGPTDQARSSPARRRSRA
jgi:hypothetical protein